MKKDEIDDMMIDLWDCVDQAGFDYWIREAMELAPAWWKKLFIERLLECQGTSNENISFDNDLVEKARLYIGWQSE